MSTQASIAFHTLGCKLNFSETSGISQKFMKAGYEVVDFETGADIYVINTCSVTDFADRKCRNIVRKAHRFSPSAKVIVMGCYAQLKPQEISDIEGVDMVLGAEAKFNILAHVNDLLMYPGQEEKVLVGDINDANTFESSYSYGQRTRTFLKVQDGCDYKCTFCTIPQARGKSRSDTIDNVLKNINEIEALGIKEIVLTGVNIGDFGNGTEVIEGLKPKKEALFIDLVKAIDSHSRVPRFRISSIEPNLCTNEIIDFVAASKRFMPHFHMPLQSGSNELLKNMRRRYKRELYRSRVEHIKTRMPHACIGVDVIVGFPGETDELFLETYQFLSSLDISYLHVFTYSERANTLAASMQNAIPVNTRRKRNEMLRLLSKEKKQTFYKQHLGHRFSALFEAEDKEGYMYGFTENYIKVRTTYDPTKANQIVAVKTLLVNGDCVEVAILTKALMSDG